MPQPNLLWLSSLFSIRRFRGSNCRITRLQNYKIRSQRGYILLVLLLFVALLAIGSLAVIQEFKFQYQRDQEEELIHRGVQYSRAVKKYFRKFGRYPTRIEDLENTNNYRSLRKRYKDPMSRDPQTGKEKDFKPLRFTDVQVSFSPGMASGLPPGADASSAQQRATPGLPNGAGGGAAGPGAVDTAGGQGQGDAQGNQTTPGTTVGGAGVSPQPGQAQTPGAEPVAASNPVFGGAAIIGVVSTNKQKTIREFNKKDHYNQWQFIYDSTTDRGGLLMTPNQPPLKGAVPVNATQNGQQGNQNQPGVGFGQGGNNLPQQPNPNPQQSDQQ